MKKCLAKSKLLQQPTASVDELLSVVQNMSSPSSPTDDPPVLLGTLTEQLTKVAEAHGGRVPLHGRLFAQWMHYAFPRECPFPHKTGAFAQHTLTPAAFGGGYIATKDEMHEHASTSGVDSDESSGSDDWMTQWSEEEELFADYSDKMQTSWVSKSLLLCFMMIAAVVWAATGVVSSSNKGQKFGTGLPSFTPQHQHFV